MKERKIKIFIFIIVTIAIFGNSAIEVLGEARCFAVAGFIGNYLLAPLVGAIAVLLLLHISWYFIWHIPKKILCRFKKSI